MDNYNPWVFHKEADDIVGSVREFKEWGAYVGRKYGWVEAYRLRDIYLYRRWMAHVFFGDDVGLEKYDATVLGIERRWDALMKRRSEPKRAAWKIDVLGDMPNN